MDKLLTLLNTYLQAAQHVITQYAPVVWNATLHLIQVNSAFNLIIRGVGTLILIAIPIVLHLVINPENKEHDHRFDKRDKKILVGCITAGVVVVTFIIWATSFYDWLGVLAPQLYLLYGVAAKAGILLN